MKIIAILLFASSSLFGNFQEIPKEMKKEVNMIYQFPETRSIIDSLDPIVLKWIPIGHDGFNAFWASDKRWIALNSSRKWEEGEKLFSILFELQNAVSDPVLQQLDLDAKEKKISQSDYVYTVEWIEYQNVIKAKEILQQGITLGYFPKNSLIPIYPDFQQHLKWQKDSGHSAHIAQKYEALQKFSL